MTESPDPDHDLHQLKAVLRNSPILREPTPEQAPDLLGAWLDAAERLRLDDRADPASLLALALTADGFALDLVDRHPPATPTMTVAILEAWRREGLQGCGIPARDPAEPAAQDARSNGSLPVPTVLVAAVFHAAAAGRLGLTVRRAAVWAASGLIDAGNSPDPVDVEDPTEYDAESDLMTDPESDECYWTLARWMSEIGPEDAPLWYSAGYTWEEAAFASALPDGDRRKPSLEELRRRAVPRALRPR